MDFLYSIGEFFNRITAGIEFVIRWLFGSSNERRVRAIGFIREKDGSTRIVPGSIVDRVGKLESKYQPLSDEELRQTTAQLRKRLDAGETLSDIEADAFAAVREAGRRFLRMRHFDVQIVGGHVLHMGMIAEMATGEGKTLVATLPAYLNGLVGHVHVVTVNDYLARRDMEWMGQIYIGLGLTVGAIQSYMGPQERQIEYAKDITYGTNNEFGFDYLRDNMKPRIEHQVQGKLYYALVDEIDNILIDEARTPLIISGEAHDDLTKYPAANKLAVSLKKDVHFEVKEKEHSCHLTEEGVRHAERLAGVESFYTAGNMHWPHLIDNALKAHHLYKRDVNYVVERDRNDGTMIVVIIDEHTGRKMLGRQWSDGLHQAVESKEGVPIKKESQTLATITLQNYFKLYKKLAGMTGTAMTEAGEFLKIYKLDVISIPTNRPNLRLNSPDVIYRSEQEKWHAVCEEVKAVHATGRPVLVGTVSIEKSEVVSEYLKRSGISHNLLNAKFHEREAEIIAQAGRKNAVTISTNMAGRGTDIILGGNPEFMAWEVLGKKYASRLDVPKSVWDDETASIANSQGMVEEGRQVAELGGLHVVGTERHDSRRIDLQLRGRAARQGDPGSSRFFISLDDNLMRIFMGDWVRSLLTSMGMQEGEAIESRMVTSRIEAAQKKVEERHFDVRKNLLEYDEVMDKQRKEIYSFRQSILEGANVRDAILSYVREQVEKHATHFLSKTFASEQIAGWAAQTMHVEFEPQRIDGMTIEQVREFIIDEAKRQAESSVDDQIELNLPEVSEESDWNWKELTRWINDTYKSSFTDRELRDTGREGLAEKLSEAALETVSTYDLSMLETFLGPEFSAIAFAGWLQRQFNLAIDHQEFVGVEVEGIIPDLQDRVCQFYREKEVRFPVTVGIAQYIEPDGPDSFRIDAARVVAFAEARLQSQIDMQELVGKSYSDLIEVLVESSRKYLASGDSISTIDERLDAAFGARTSKEPQNDVVQIPDGIKPVIDWANRDFAADLDVDDFDHATRASARQLILKAYDRRYRPELHHTERLLILDILDTAWKEHLYFMDHLRQAVAFSNYAQKDPKTEYTREGMLAFDEMKRRIGELATSNLFRIEHSISPEYMSSLWQITSETHAAAEPDMPAAPEPAPPVAHAPQGRVHKPDAEDSSRKEKAEVPAVQPIRNRGQRIGRNDPCPCGSGKKYKKCCGEHA